MWPTIDDVSVEHFLEKGVYCQLGYIVIIHPMSSSPDNYSTFKDTLSAIGILTTATVAIGGLVYASMGLSTRCPACHEWFAMYKAKR